MIQNTTQSKRKLKGKKISKSLKKNRFKLQKKQETLMENQDEIFFLLSSVILWECVSARNILFSSQSKRGTRLLSYKILAFASDFPRVIVKNIVVVTKVFLMAKLKKKCFEIKKIYMLWRNELNACD